MADGPLINNINRLLASPMDSWSGLNNLLINHWYPKCERKKNKKECERVIDSDVRNLI